MQELEPELKEPDRGEIDDLNIEWNFARPDYSLVNLAYLMGKTARNGTESAVLFIENLIKRCEMEIKHKNRSQWKFISQDDFSIQLNGKDVTEKTLNLSRNFTSDNRKCPLSNPFPWEVTEIFSDKPKCTFAWRHWNENIELNGFAIVELRGDNKIKNIKVFYKSDEIITKFASENIDSLYDYFFGFEDLMERRVKFVGNADTRIKEDFLRILRYFRFYGRIAKSPDQHDPETLKIISNNAEGLQRVSGERIWVELKKILQGNFAGEILMTIIDCGLSQHIGLPSNPDKEDFRNLCKNQSIAKDCDPITILAALLNLPEDALHLHERLKFSAYERDLLYFLAQNKNEFRDVDDLIRYQQMCLITSGKIKDIKEYVEELLKLHCKLDLHQKLKEWTVPRFPVTGSLLLQNNCPTGKIVGVVLNKLKVIWVESEFKLTSEELLEHLPQIFKDLNIVDGKLVKKPKTQ
ncbi:CLUMA_CG012009, isoform C [Clunio marinus]|uniref:CLUMA_CG012009, isoform C n=1 Tax=Clunio marinus TaxID=568069 RepID=A0A1J1IEQ9_9DIPT|nr:CLUMA_CG012009, isoform C [Clunio marinus]